MGWVVHSVGHSGKCGRADFSPCTPHTGRNGQKPTQVSHLPLPGLLRKNHISLPTAKPPPEQGRGGGAPSQTFGGGSKLSRIASPPLQRSITHWEGGLLFSPSFPPSHSSRELCIHPFRPSQYRNKAAPAEHDAGMLRGKPESPAPRGGSERFGAGRKGGHHHTPSRLSGALSWELGDSEPSRGFKGGAESDGEERRGRGERRGIQDSA